jgi:hypothetical protein
MATLTLQECFHHHNVSELRLGGTGLNAGLGIDACVHYHDIDSADIFSINGAYHAHVLSRVELQYQYWLEFTGMTVGVIPPGWTERYLGSQNYTVQNVGQASEQALLMDSTVGTIETICSWNAMTGLVDVEILYSAYIATNQNEQPNFAVRASGSIGSEYFYVLSGLVTSNQLRINKWVNGSRSQIGAAVSKTLNTTTWYWVRFRVVGSDLKAKVWAGGSSEPAAWDIERTDSAITGGGWIGPQCGDWNNAYWYTAAISVGTGGATANNILGVFDSNHDLADDGPLGLTMIMGVNSAYHTHAAENVYFIEDLVVAPGIHDHGAGTLSLFTVHGSSHVHVADHIPNFNENVLANNAYHTHAADVLNPFSIYGAYHQHIGDIAVLAVSLTVQESAHDLVDGGPLTIKAVLSVNDCTHSHGANAIAGMDIAIQVAETYHAHDSPAVALIVPLTAQEAYHLQQADLVGLIVSLAVQEAAHEHAADSVLFVPTLANLDSYHIHLADQVTVTITEVFDLVVQPAYLFHDSQQSPEGYYNLRLGISMLVNAAFHAHVADNVATTTERNLAVIEAYHTIASDNIDFNQDFIRPADGDHVVDSDNVALGVHLVVAEAAHAVVDGGALGLQTVTVMTVAEAFHDHVAQAPGIHPWLAIQEAYHAHVVDATPITQNIWLTVSSEQYHAVVSDNIAFSALSRTTFKYTYLVRYGT